MKKTLLIILSALLVVSFIIIIFNQIDSKETSKIASSKQNPRVVDRKKNNDIQEHQKLSKKQYRVYNQEFKLSDIFSEEELKYQKEKINEVSHTKNVIIYVSNDVNIKKDKLNNIVKSIDQKIYAGEILIISKNHSIYYYPLTNIVLKKDKIAKDIATLNKHAFNKQVSLDNVIKPVSSMKYSITIKDEKNNIIVYQTNNNIKISQDTIKNIAHNLMPQDNNAHKIILTANKDGIITSVNISIINHSKIDTVSNVQAIGLNSRIQKYDYIYSFDFDKYLINDVNKTKILFNNLDAILKAKIKIKSIVVIGYTDNIGTERYNLKLSMKRSIVLNQKLLKYAKNIKNVAKGKSSYIASNDTEIGRSKNRRIEVYLVWE